MELRITDTFHGGENLAVYREVVPIMEIIFEGQFVLLIHRSERCLVVGVADEEGANEHVQG